ncbi:hypothetical protein [Streptomyces sp. NPDC026659]|uniref:hypothetical protein n=1 Tax=Streptomyces sp. NPDC026659 TaxID=3155123 RepID=UPI0033D9F5C7
MTSPSGTRPQRPSSSTTILGNSASHATPASPSRSTVLRANSSGIATTRHPTREPASATKPELAADTARQTAHYEARGLQLEYYRWAAPE